MPDSDEHENVMPRSFCCYIPMFWKNLLLPSSEQMDTASLSLISTSNCVSVLHLSSLFQRASKFYIYGSGGCICVPSTSTRPQYCKMHFYMNISFFQTYPISLSFMYTIHCEIFKVCLVTSKKRERERKRKENGL